MPVPSLAETARISSRLAPIRSMISLARTLRLGAGQIDLVEYRDDLEPGVHREKEVAQGLGLDPLGRVHHQNGPLARGKGAGDLVGEVHVARACRSG